MNKYNWSLDVWLKSDVYKLMMRAAIISLALILLATVFVYWYWNFQRPKIIAKNCQQEIANQTANLVTDQLPAVYETLYQSCLQARGIEK